MKYIKGVSYIYDYASGRFNDEAAKFSLSEMKRATCCDTVVFVLCALQDTAQSETIDVTGFHMPTDDELKNMITYAKKLGLRVIIKPFVNCRDGTWRAHINFFDIAMPGEPCWDRWFESYTAYQLHYAHIAQATNCDMMIIGCEMVQAQRKESYWREMIIKIRKVYRGPLTYNADKYTEDHVPFWDALDVISSSGYYPIDDWERQLDRIEVVIKREKKPFFFSEAGCMSIDTSPMRPNNWALEGDLSLAAQAHYFETMFNHCRQRPYVEGFAIWEWASHLYKIDDGRIDKTYAVYGKPAADVIAAAYR